MTKIDNILEKTDRNTLIDSLKGFAIFLVCWGHSIQFLKKDLNSFFDNPVFILIYSFHMPLFMMISGYLFFYSIKKNSLIWVASKRLLQLIIPSVSWFIFESLVIGRDINIPNVKYGAVFPFWFLSALFVACIVMAISNSTCKDKPWMVFALIFFASLFLGDSWNMDRTKFLAPYFLLGFCAHYCMSFIERSKHWIGCISSIIWVAMLFLWDKELYIYITKMTFQGVEFWHQFYVVIFRYAIGFFGAVSAIYLYSYTLSLRGFSLVASYIGGFTLPIYIISTLTLSRIAGFFDVGNHINNKVIYNLLVTPLFASLIIFFCISIAVVLKKTSLTRFLFLGGR
ncbi:acyltransferase family protein [Kosakonia cowanii]|uniref:acyltransferase family protein n=1 Tax=Kosakonia cowanii TaxID=208223 RepID=UPI002DDD036D|nr:acyltransferase family protein [Kosakonia cowanii]WRY59632.1 acyltransferase family protein [Kosakonia cowanii]